jgi:MFS family permease
MSVQTFFLYFVHDIIQIRTNPEAAVATLAILGQCAGALTCYPVGFISDRFGGRRQPFVYAACFLLAATTLAMSMVTTFHQMVILSLILGAANGMYLTMDTSLAVDTLPENNGTESAQLLGIWGVAAFLGSALGPMVGGPLLSIFSVHPTAMTNDDVPEEYSRAGYTLVYVLSAMYFTCSAFALLYIRDK